MRIHAGVVMAATGLMLAAGARAADKPATPDQVYAKQCVGCHAKDGSGNPKMVKTLKVELAELNLVDEPSQKKADAELVKTVTDGLNKKMPSFAKKLTASQIQEIVAFVRSLAKPKS